MSSPQQKQIEQAEQETEDLSRRAYGIALPAQRGQLGLIQKALAGGESPGMRAAFGGARTSLIESGLEGERANEMKMRADDRGALLGGNTSAAMAQPGDVGSNIARALYGSRITEAGSQIEENNKLFSMSIGRAADSGSGSLRAFGNELSNVSTMQPYNSAYSNILGALNAAGTLYGAGQKQGWFSTSQAGGPNITPGVVGAGFGG